MVNPYNLVELTTADITKVVDIKKVNLNSITTEELENIFIEVVELAVQGVEYYKDYTLKMLLREFRFEFEEEISFLKNYC